jgi:hypothetical protein
MNKSFKLYAYEIQFISSYLKNIDDSFKQIGFIKTGTKLYEEYIDILEYIASNKYDSIEYVNNTLLLHITFSGDIFWLFKIGSNKHDDCCIVTTCSSLKLDEISVSRYVFIVERGIRLVKEVER